MCNWGFYLQKAQFGLAGACSVLCWISHAVTREIHMDRSRFVLHSDAN